MIADVDWFHGSDNNNDSDDKDEKLPNTYSANQGTNNKIFQSDLIKALKEEIQRYYRGENIDRNNNTVPGHHQVEDVAKLLAPKDRQTIKN